MISTSDTPAGMIVFHPVGYDAPDMILHRSHIFIDKTFIEMYLVGVSVRWVEDISEALWGTRLIIGDKALDMTEAIGEVFPNAKYQRCTVHLTESKQFLVCILKTVYFLRELWYHCLIFMG